jgi:16S rRNA (adenine(1408)-N(1))-methyltransferase
VLAVAAAQADRLVVGVDASAAGMAEASRRAARRAGRRGLPNALFVVAAAEALPRELDGLADRVTVHFPWGSLLRGLLAADPAILGGLVRVMRPGATLSMLVSSTARDRGAGVEPLDERALAALAVDYGRSGLEVTRIRPATPADVAASRSTWGRRLGAGAQRPAWLLEARLAKLGEAGAGLVEAGRGLVDAGPRVGGGQAVGDGAQGVPPRVEVVQLRPVEGDRDGRAG